MTDLFQHYFSLCPLVAILRGIRPDEAEAIGEALVDNGFALIEVPLNSPDPFDSIARMARRLGDRALVGAGTVLSVEAVEQVRAAAGRMIIAPNANPAVIARAASHGVPAIPGIFTPTEAFAALEAGAAALKLFPAEGGSPAMLKAMRAVLPKTTRMLPVGGITPESMTPWIAAGANGFGLGSALYKPGQTAEQVAVAAQRFARAWSAASATD